MKKNVVKLNESKLKKIVAESVKRVLREAQYNAYGEPSYDSIDMDRGYFHDLQAMAANTPQLTLSAEAAWKSQIHNISGDIRWYLERLEKHIFPKLNDVEQMKKISDKLREAEGIIYNLFEELTEEK